MTTPFNSLIDRAAAELWQLMHKKKGHVDIALFPAVVNSNRVQDIASDLGLSLENGEELREALSAILSDLEQQERVARQTDDDKQPGTRDYVSAKPLRELLGLTATTQYKTIGPRQRTAAKSRRWHGAVSESTMRKHTKPLTEEFAHYLCSTYPQTDESSDTTNDRIAVDFAQELETLRRHNFFVDVYVALKDSSIEYFDGLIEQLAEEYRDLTLVTDQFHSQVARDNELSARLGADPLIDDADYFVSLLALAGIGFARSESVDHTNDGKFLRRGLATYFVDAFLLIAEPHPLRCSVWLGRLISILEEQCLPLYTLRDKELLRDAANQANGNLHRFLIAMEESDQGVKLLLGWKKHLTEDWSQTGPPWVGFTFSFLVRALSLVEQVRRLPGATELNGEQLQGVTDFIANFENGRLKREMSFALEEHGCLYPGIR